MVQVNVDFPTNVAIMGQVAKLVIFTLWLDIQLKSHSRKMVWRSANLDQVSPGGIETTEQTFKSGR